MPNNDKKPSSSRVYCAAINCNNNKRTNPGLRFFHFPSDATRSKKWLEQCRRQDLIDKTVSYLRRNCFMCSKHFEQEFLPKFCNQRARLSPKAIPTIFNFPNPCALPYKRAATTSETPGQKSKRKRKVAFPDSIVIERITKEFEAEEVTPNNNGSFSRTVGCQTPHYLTTNTPGKEWLKDSLNVKNVDINGLRFTIHHVKRT